MKKNTKAFTLIELLIAMFMIAILMYVAVYIFQTVLSVWSVQGMRTDIDTSLYKGLDIVAIDLRDSSSVQSSNDEIRFTSDSTNCYIYYLYNPADKYPPAFNQSSYQLKKATLSGGINGTFTYGSGQLIMANVLPPPNSDMSLTNNVLNIDLGITKGNETVRAKTEIHPRNT